LQTDYIYFYQVPFLLPINKTISFVPHREARSSGWHRAFPSFYTFNLSLLAEKIMLAAIFILSAIGALQKKSSINLSC